ncbi:MAG: hypothetical protein U0Y10_13530 [Spirosomataceae bacterium]
MHPQSLKAIDLEETLTGSDEILMVYSLTAFDQNKKITSTTNRVWGVEKVTTNQLFGKEKFVPVQLAIPPKGQIEASVILLEIENYQKAQQLIEKLRKANGLATIPMMALEVGEAATPLRYLTIALSVLGESLKMAAYFDTNDLLGEQTYLLSTSELKKKNFQMRIPVTFKDKHLTGTYEYQLVYDLTVKGSPAKRK